ncbi:hypothetical protein [Bradyrhizobium sp. LMTR 3]|uniref:hypothetical protein n=1 Tax=Bradyrhizobium sp. LMTR 3 TaxID=189873 RepID=UPI0008106A58|nr:hypothetical protein [Bradyrhizobium sp. LMTR 3]OCK60528.1 hypothetical protein LMTR3_15420 [Bradyrhizobium sp. LMTR 3]
MSSDVIFLYDQVIECISRLHAFCSVKERDLGADADVESDIDAVTELLARRDLLTFAASTRNFAEACKAVSDMRSIEVPTCKLLPPPVRPPFFIETEETITLYQTLSRILHSTAVTICRSVHDYEHLLVSSNEELLELIGQRRGKTLERSEPLILLESGKNDPFTLLRVRSIVLRSCAFLNNLSDRLSKDRIFLQRDYRDL